MQQPDQQKQFFRNALWTLLELGLYPLLMLIATPLFINHLGAAQYGLWMLVNTFIQGIHILNFGLGDSTIRLISRHRGHGNLAAVQGSLRRNIQLAALVAAAGVLIAWLLAASDFLQFFNLGEQASMARNLLLYGGIAAGLKFFELVSMGFFKGFERFDIAARLSMLSRCSVLLVNIGLVMSGYSLEDIFRSIALMALLNVLVQYVFLFSFMRGTPTAQTAAKDDKEEQAHYFWYWLQSSVALAGFLSDKLLVGHFTDMQTLGYYSIASLVGIQIHNVLLSLGSFVFPRISYLQARGISGRQVQQLAAFLLNSFGWLLLGGLLLGGDVLFRWWLGESSYTASIPFIRLYLVFECVIILIIVPYHYINGSAGLRWNSFFELLLRSSQLAGMLLAYSCWGGQGLILGLIGSTLINLPFQYYIFHKKILHDNASTEWQRVLIIPLLFTAMLFFPQTWIKILLALLVIGCIKWFYYNPVRPLLAQLLPLRKNNGH